MTSLVNQSCGFNNQPRSFYAEISNFKKCSKSWHSPVFTTKCRVWSSQDARVHILVLFYTSIPRFCTQGLHPSQNFQLSFFPTFFSDFFFDFSDSEKCVCAQWEDIQRQLIVGVSTFAQSDFTTFFSLGTFFKKFFVKISSSKSSFWSVWFEARSK